MDEKVKAVTLTESGAEKMEEMLKEAGLLTQGALYELENVSLVHHSNQALRAHKLLFATATTSSRMTRSSSSMSSPAA